MLPSVFILANWMSISDEHIVGNIDADDGAVVANAHEGHPGLAVPGQVVGEGADGLPVCPGLALPLRDSLNSTRSPSPS